MGHQATTQETSAPPRPESGPPPLHRPSHSCLATTPDILPVPDDTLPAIVGGRHQPLLPSIVHPPQLPEELLHLVDPHHPLQGDRPLPVVPSSDHRTEEAVNRALSGPDPKTGTSVRGVLGGAPHGIAGEQPSAGVNLIAGQTETRGRNQSGDWLVPERRHMMGSPPSEPEQGNATLIITTVAPGAGRPKKPPLLPPVIIFLPPKRTGDPVHHHSPLGAM